MKFEKQSSSIMLAIGAAISFSGCAEPNVDEKSTIASETKALNAFNGQAWNGQAWNGQAWNGQAWNGQAWNGIGWNGQAWNGIGWNGQAWNGQAWNGQAWNGQAWNGQAWNGQAWNGQAWNGQAWNGVAGQDAPIFTMLHTWMNHTDVNQNGIPNANAVGQCGPPGTYDPSYLNDADDLAQRLGALGAWVSCACPSTTTIPFSDTHGRSSVIFQGSMGLAPTWCGSDMNAAVPQGEVEIVSACLMARINMKGKHYPLSLRTLEAGTALSTNEQFLSNRPLALYWGNLFKAPHSDDDGNGCKYDPNDPSCNNPVCTGGTWWNMERFSMALADPNGSGPMVAGQLSDQLPFGRDCEIGSCDGHLEFLGSTANDVSSKAFGDAGYYDPANPGKLYYKGVSPNGAACKTNGGVVSHSAPSQGGGTTTATIEYRNPNRQWRVLEAYGPRSIPLENPATSFPGWGRTAWAQVEGGQVPKWFWINNVWNWGAPTCAGGINECEGKPGANGGKLFGLDNTQMISLNMSANGPSADPYNHPNFFYNYNGDPNEPVALAIRYSWSGKDRTGALLGDGQCDVDNGCMNTRRSQCSSGLSYGNGCVGGLSTSGQLRVWVNHNRPQGYVPDAINPLPGNSKNLNKSEWAYVHGPNSPYGKNMFPSTYGNTQYSTAYIYPIYLQDSVKQITGATDYTAGVTYDTIRARISGATADNRDAPDLDTAYFFPGMPPGDADCTGIGGCFLFSGPNLILSASSGGQWSYTWPAAPMVYNQPAGAPDPGMSQYWYTSPTLPPGTYTFQLTNMTGGDLDLYVKANGQVLMTNWDCRPYAGANTAETCIVSLTRPGYISAMVRGYSASIATATFTGHN